MVLNRITVDSIPAFELREADRLECLAAGISPELAVKRSVLHSNNAFAVYADGRLLCLWGFRFEEDRTQAFMWLLSTPAVEDYRVAFSRTSQRMLGILLEEVMVIKVLVHCKHVKARRWLEWLGFRQAENYNEHFMLMKRVR